MKTLDKNPAKIEKMFDEISNNYDFLNNIISFFTHIFIKKSAINLLNIENPVKILDLCSGSGDLGRIVLKKFPNSKIFGVDFSSEMIKIAKSKNKNIEYYKADACNLPFGDNFFDVIVMGFGLRNIQDKEKSINEIYRVLKDGGLFLHLDFGYKNMISKIYDFFVLFFTCFLKNKNAYKYLIDSKNSFENPDELILLFEKYKLNLKKRKDYLFKTVSAQVLSK